MSVTKSEAKWARTHYILVYFDTVTVTINSLYIDCTCIWAIPHIVEPPIVDPPR